MSLCINSLQNNQHDKLGETNGNNMKQLEAGCEDVLSKALQNSQEECGERMRTFEVCASNN